LTASSERTGAQHLVDALITLGVDTVFGVPGESYLAVLDALYGTRGRIRFIVNRHESGASFMADAYAKLTGKPGVAFVTRGPGATNAAIGVHSAFQDSVPLVLFIGQVGTDFMEREAFQEIDYRRMFGPMAKWVAQVERADRMPEYVARAFQLAQSGRPGPCVLALPEDVLTATAAAPSIRPVAPVRPAPSAAQMQALQARLVASARPIVLLGGSGWTPAAGRDLSAFVHRFQLPVACAFRFQDLFDNDDAHYAGDVGIGINPRLAERIRAADLVLAIGPRLGEMTTGGYALLSAPVPAQPLIHVHAGVEELGRVYQAELLIASGMPEIAAALAALPAPANPPWQASVAEARAEYESWQAEPPVFAQRPGSLNQWRIVQTLRAQLPRDAIIANGAGNFATWAHRYYRYGGLGSHGRTQLAPTSGAMGYGVPAGIAAQLADPQRTVVIFAGDGDFLMTGQELATAVQHGAAPIVLVFNNGMYGTIRMHQERHYPGRTLGTGLTNPDFSRLAQAYGAWGRRIDRTDEFASVWQEAVAFTQAKSRPALIEIMVDPDIITPGMVIAAGGV
jgi:acetolactate synthase-1/2/3 large subunit